MRRRLPAMLFAFLLLMQLISGGRLAHIHADGTAELSLAHSHQSESPEEAAAETQVNHCPCGHHHHKDTPQDQPDDQPEDIPSHVECKASIAFAANTANYVEVLDLPALITTFPSIELGLSTWPSQALAANAVPRAPPRALTLAPPSSEPLWLSIQQFRL